MKAPDKNSHLKSQKVRTALSIFLAAAFLRFLYLGLLVSSHDLTQEDQRIYIDLSEQIQLAKLPSWDKITPARTIGYPVFLALVKSQFGALFPAVPILQAFLDSLTCVLVFLMAQRLGVNAAVAGVLSALNLNMIILCGMLLTDCFFLFLLSSFGYLFILSWQRQCVRSGILAILFLTLATYIRSASYYLIFPVLVVLSCYFFYHQGFRATTTVVLGGAACFLLVLGPRHYQNWAEFRSTALVTQAGVGTLFWYYPGVYQYSGQGSYGEGENLARQKLQEAMERDSLQELPQNPFEQQRYLLSVGREAIKDLGLTNLAKAWVTGAVLNLLAPSVVYAPAVRALPRPSFYYTSGRNSLAKIWNYVKDVRSRTYLGLLLAGFISSATFLGLTLWGFGSLLAAGQSRSEQLLILLLGALVLYFLLITGPIVSPKYRLPCEPVLTIFATAGLQKCLRLIQERI